MAVAPKVEPEDLVTAADIGRRLGVSGQRAHQLVQQARFPKPVGRVAGSDVWSTTQVERWRRERVKERWIADAIALVPRTGGLTQSALRMALQIRLSNALGARPEMPDATVAEVVDAAIDDAKGHGPGVPRFDARLRQLQWPDLDSGGGSDA
jgi:hypothetical protein